MSKIGEQFEKNLDNAKYDLYEAVKVALWDEENGEYEAQKQGHSRLIERLEIYRKALAKVEKLDKDI